MPSERSDTTTRATTRTDTRAAATARVTDASASHEDPHALAAAEDPHALAAAATRGDAALEAAFWRARAEELAARLTRLEDRLRALGERLPARWAQLLACDPDDLPQRAHWPDPLTGWREGTELAPGRVAHALPRLWDRLDPDASR